RQEATGRARVSRTYLVFGDIEGKLDTLRVECTKCPRKGRYSVRKLIEKYGRKANMMKWKEKLLVGLLITGTLCLACTPRPAVAGSGDVAAGIVGGLAVGTLFGAAVASGPRYYAPAPVYVAPAPVYVGPTCYWTRVLFRSKQREWPHCCARQAA